MPIRPYRLNVLDLDMIQTIAARNQYPRPDNVLKPDPNIAVESLLAHIAWQDEIIKAQTEHASADLGTVVDITMRMNEANVAREIYLAMNDSPPGTMPRHRVGNDKIQNATEAVLRLLNGHPTPPHRS